MDPMKPRRSGIRSAGFRLGFLLLVVGLFAIVPMSETLWAKRLGISGEIHLTDWSATPADEGCTPGFWKQEHHLRYWPEPYGPTRIVSGVFGLPVGEAQTLLEALDLGGGGVAALLRQSTAALMNAGSPYVRYPLTAEEVILGFTAAYESADPVLIERMKDEFEQFNESVCPLPEAWPKEQKKIGSTPLVLVEPTEAVGGSPTAIDPSPTPKFVNGCGASYWMNPETFSGWPEGYAPENELNALLANKIQEPTSLLVALMFEGGGRPGLLRETVAALLNAESEVLEYPFSAGEIIERVSIALEGDDLAEIEALSDLYRLMNEGSCPLGHPISSATMSAPNTATPSITQVSLGTPTATQPTTPISTDTATATMTASSTASSTLTPSTTATSTATASSTPTRTITPTETSTSEAPG
jgi:hypothetical protein